MNKYDVDQITLRDVEGMSRLDLIASLNQISAFFPRRLSPTQIEGMSDPALRELVKKARRKFQQMGY